MTTPLERLERSGPNRAPGSVVEGGRTFCTYEAIIDGKVVTCERAFSHNSLAANAERRYHGNGWRWTTMGTNLAVQTRTPCPANDPCRNPGRV